MEYMREHTARPLIELDGDGRTALGGFLEFGAAPPP